jgi:sterol desaturase/sphingolipid hydroxylase (fatty acid hydroxylase superfamily)
MPDKSQLIPAHLAPQKGEIALFGNAIMERLSRISPITVLFIYIPITSYSLYLCFARGSGLAATVGLFVAGFLFWTLFEYIFHRYVFHFFPEGELQTRLQFLIHGVHHQYPNDKERLVMPVSVSILVAGLILALFLAIFDQLAWGFFAGFVAGYIAYDMIHYSIHNFQPPGPPWIKAIWVHHLAHHYRDTTRGFGVSSPVWDTVFGTRHEYEKNRKQPI